jgi:hypothetical protein
MSDRLQELLRQKALLAEQAAWLEREIAAEQARAGVTPPAAATAAPASPPPASAVATTEALFEQYRPNPQSVQQEVKRGCYLYFLGALVVLGLGVLAIYLVYRHR